MESGDHWDTICIAPKVKLLLSFVPGKRTEKTIKQAVTDAASRLVQHGPRPAIFTDGESAYKQADGVSYHARDMAIVRAQLVGFPVILASATPSLETRVNVSRGRYGRLELPERFGAATPPTVEAVDMRESGLRADQFLAPTLRDALTKTIGDGEQALIQVQDEGIFVVIPLPAHVGKAGAFDPHDSLPRSTTTGSSRAGH